MYCNQNSWKWVIFITFWLKTVLKYFFDKLLYSSTLVLYHIANDTFSKLQSLISLLLVLLCSMSSETWTQCFSVKPNVYCHECFFKKSFYGCSHYSIFDNVPLILQNIKLFVLTISKFRHFALFCWSRNIFEIRINFRSFCS